MLFKLSLFTVASIFCVFLRVPLSMNIDEYITTYLLFGWRDDDLSRFFKTFKNIAYESSLIRAHEKKNTT